MKENNKNSQTPHCAKSIAYKIFHHPITRIIIGLLVCFSIPFLFKTFVSKPTLELLIPLKVFAKSIQHLFTMAILFASYYFLFKYYEKREISEFSIKFMLKESLVGFFGGGILISFIILILFLLGYYKIIAANDFSIFFLPLLTLAMAALMEEILYRGIIYRILEKWLGTKVALIIPSLIFGFTHVTNENATIIGVLGAIIGGLLASIMFTYTKRLWVPFTFHFGWNFAQLIYGSNVSGMDEFGVLFNSQLEGPQLLIGSKFGIEDSIFSLIFTGILFIVIYYKANKKGFIIKPSWNNREQ